jgi:hypothetical protein
MADLNITLPSLPAAATVNLSDLMLVRQGSQDKKATLQVLKDLLLNNRSFTGQDILELLAPVDGAGSGLDADLLDGQHGAFYQNASNLNAGIIPQARLSALDILLLLQGVDGTGSDLDADLLDGQHGSFYQNATNLNAGTVPQARLSASTILNLLLGVDGAGSGVDADLLDGQHGSFYQNASNLNAGTINSARVSGQYPNAQINASNLYTGTVPGARLTNSSTSTRGIIELATQSEVNAGSDNERAVTPSTLKNAINTISGITATAQTTNGSLSIPYSATNAITIKWGIHNHTFESNPLTTVFGTPFSAAYQAVCSYTVAGKVDLDDSAQVSSLSTTGITTFTGNPNRAVSWFAIGRTAI